MKRIILLLLPVVAMAVGAPNSSNHKSREETLSVLWQASVSAESSGDTAAAVEKLMAFAKGGGDPYLANLRAGWLKYGAQKYDEATRFYVAAARLQPQALSARLGLLNTAQAKGDGAAAIIAAESVLKVEPTNYRALMAVAWGSFQSKDYRRSGIAYQRVLTLYPEDMDALSGAAWCAFYNGHKSEAKEGFRRLMSMNPDYSYARQGLAATSR